MDPRQAVPDRAVDGDPHARAHLDMEAQLPELHAMRVAAAEAVLIDPVDVDPVAFLTDDNLVAQLLLLGHVEGQ